LVEVESSKDAACGVRHDYSNVHPRTIDTHVDHFAGLIEMIAINISVGVGVSASNFRVRALHQSHTFCSALQRLGNEELTPQSARVEPCHTPANMDSESAAGTMAASGLPRALDFAAGKVE
jgi:hypothetical protein